ncbi:MAG: MarR family winged helix-turn-helix transcriptional regulator [Pseudomonadota bacterium]
MADHPSSHGPLSPGFSLAAFLPYRLSLLANTVSQGLAALYQDQFDLSPAEWRVIAVLGREGAASAKDIAAITAMDKVTISRAIARLAKAGRVTAKVDKTDRRRQRLVLGPNGRAVYERVAPLALAYEQRLLAGLGEGERRQLDRLLAVLQQAAQRASPRP